VFGSWTLLHYRKQLMAHETFSVCQPEVSLFSLGTFAYKSHDARKSVEAIFEDHRVGNLDTAALVGAYCMLFCSEKRISFITDPMNLFHVFTNQEQTVFSSSFAAVLKAGPKKYRLNVPATVENALTGYIIGPETIVHGIELCDKTWRKKRTDTDVVFEPSSHKLETEEPGKTGSLSACVDEQFAELNRYFALFKGLVDEAGGVDVGLSGGYDSRVLILMAKRHFDRVYAHSHFHRATTSDETCAGKIAAALDVPLYLCSDAKQPAEMDSEEFERNLENTAAFNDGRVIHDYSWLVFFRTRWYREAVLRDHRFGMNGLGGELYRNHDNHGYGSVETRGWIKARILGVGATLALHRQALDGLIDRVVDKAEIVLNADLSRRITHHQTRRYFGELFSIYGAAVRMNIDSQLAYSLSPFLDAGPRLASYRALPHVGLDGRFEAEMIRRLDPALASITSTYGYAFDRRPPLSRLAKCALRGWVPLDAQNALNAARRKRSCAPSVSYERVYAQQPLVRRAVELMRAPRFGIDWDAAVCDEILIMRIVSVGIMLLKYEDCIDLG
jgi:asparagine synthase (glutamine-hydrolysing)